jgi:hypothetical protein
MFFLLLFPFFWIQYLLKLFSIFAGGLSAFLVVLGDSNLNLDLPFGVQTLAIEKALAHENYDTASGLHTSDIGRRI